MPLGRTATRHLGFLSLACALAACAGHGRSQTGSQLKPMSAPMKLLVVELLSGEASDLRLFPLRSTEPPSGNAGWRCERKRFGWACVSVLHSDLWLFLRYYEGLLDYLVIHPGGTVGRLDDLCGTYGELKSSVGRRLGAPLRAQQGPCEDEEARQNEEAPRLPPSCSAWRTPAGVVSLSLDRLVEDLSAAHLQLKLGPELPAPCPDAEIDQSIGAER